MRHPTKPLPWSLIALIALAAGGCSSAPPMTTSGYLSDYAQLRPVDGDANRMRYVSPEVQAYKTFVVDPVEWRTPPGSLSAEDRAKIVAHFRVALVDVLKGQGFTITDRPTSDTARIRIAITNVHESTWWMKIHPASSLAGAGRGGVTFEGEVIDAVSGKQLAAFVRAGVGSQFTVGNFSTLSDVENVIDQWANDASARLGELRAAKQ